MTICSLLAMLLILPALVLSESSYLIQPQSSLVYYFIVLPSYDVCEISNHKASLSFISSTQYNVLLTVIIQNEDMNELLRITQFIPSHSFSHMPSIMEINILITPGPSLQKLPPSGRESGTKD